MLPTMCILDVTVMSCIGEGRKCSHITLEKYTTYFQLCWTSTKTRMDNNSNNQFAKFHRISLKYCSNLKCKY